MLDSNSGSNNKAIDNRGTGLKAGGGGKAQWHGSEVEGLRPEVVQWKMATAGEWGWESKESEGW